MGEKDLMGRILTKGESCQPLFYRGTRQRHWVLGRVLRDQQERLWDAGGGGAYHSTARLPPPGPGASRLCRCTGSSFTQGWQASKSRAIQLINSMPGMESAPLTAATCKWACLSTPSYGKTPRPGSQAVQGYGVQHNHFFAAPDK